MSYDGGDEDAEMIELLRQDKERLVSVLSSIADNEGCSCGGRSCARCKLAYKEARELLAEESERATPFPPEERYRIFRDAARHLLDDHDCDGHGHEGVRYALDADARHGS